MKLTPQNIEKFKTDPVKKLAKAKPFTFMATGYAFTLIGTSIIVDLDMFDGAAIPSSRKIVMK